MIPRVLHINAKKASKVKTITKQSELKNNFHYTSKSPT